MMFKLVIGGKLVEGATSLDVINPATGKAFATCARASLDQLNEAVAAAKRSQPGWAHLSHADRRGYLLRLCDAIEERANQFARLLTQEQGKPLLQANGEISGALRRFRYYADLDCPPVVLRESETEQVIQYYSPLGVLAAITPWNFPFSLLISKIAPGLIAGNTIVAKPAPTTPLTTLFLGEIAVDILPAGVLNVIVDTNDLGQQLTSHPDIAKIGFTGSTETGRRVMQSAAGTLKRLTLELGGNDAAIVLDDADMPAVARKVFDAAMLNAGQVCLAAKRVFVPRKMVDRFCEEVSEIARQTRVGDGLDEKTQMGPLQNVVQFEKVLDLIETARSQGTVIAGGHALDRPGYFIAPTIVRDLDDHAQLVKSEQFGPVMPILAYDTEDEVIQRANASPFGLGATVWTSDYNRGVDVARRLDVGTAWVNRHLDLAPEVPFGGAKQSGIGQENGVEGLKASMQLKILNVAKTTAH
ncbi:aldehyde dehydrogenase family protein [Paraburkholderia oxyphila]|uniref:aldehyde dehydrogenase family protein n=1 Tax=Paraburkholderia oxyphila TaxID=614212 RepID=UPI0004809BD3|nr:aldehyde dehydrogenase family protein [Paraburkholderia oxyphila]